ncbi:hypothetical protein [Amycolatopsis sp. NPDC059657]|uniref:hypothetical protein n=1 Tax=Amycolatopsis sp. NPDC059657 TaxID=3346899 RepID=UPI003671542D
MTDPHAPAADIPAASPAATEQSATSPVPAGDAIVDYKALYEKAQGKLSKAEQAAKEHKAKATRLDELEAAQQSDAEKATARAQAAEQQVDALRRKAVDAEIRAAASGWADPTDAPRYLDDRDRYIGEGGEIDTTTITADLAAVLLARPHLARTADGVAVRRPAPDPSQGARQSGPAGYDSRIAEAERAGDWATAITLKNQRLAEQAQQR